MNCIFWTLHITSANMFFLLGSLLREVFSVSSLCSFSCSSSASVVDSWFSRNPFQVSQCSCQWHCKNWQQLILCFDGQQNTYQMSMGRLTHKLGQSSQNFDSLTLCWEKVFLYDWHNSFKLHNKRSFYWWTFLATLIQSFGTDINCEYSSSS